MDFATIGKLSTYVKTKNLTFAAKHKIRTGQTLTNANGNFISMTTSTFDKLREAAKASTDQAKQQKLAAIKRKLKAGQKLSDEELGFLRVNDPKTYKKAKHVDDAREELKSELKKAKTKEEAREAMTRAMVKASTEAMAELTALGQDGGGSANAQQGGGAMNVGGEVSAEGNANISGGEVSAEGNANISGTENQTLAEVNQSIQTAGDKATDSINGDDKNPSAQSNSDDADKMTPEDIMEKFLWTVRALEDEWEHFTNLKDYKDLPKRHADKVKVDTPKVRLMNALAAYRRTIGYPVA